MFQDIAPGHEHVANTNAMQRGLVPSLSYNGNIITESGIVAQFIADAHPSHLLPPSGPAENALYRARLSFFVDAFFSKVVPNLFASLRSASEDERDAVAEQLAAAVVKEIEPLLAETEGKGPFFGGSDKLTLAEVCREVFFLCYSGFTWDFILTENRSNLALSCCESLASASPSTVWLAPSYLLCWRRHRASSAGRRLPLATRVSTSFGRRSKSRTA